MTKGTTATPTSQPNPAHFTFTRLLSLSSKCTDVAALQQILKSAGFYTYPTITGYFGTLTEKALAAYQKARGLEAVGYTGPKTRALLNTIATLSSTASASTAASIASSTPATQVSTSTAATSSASTTLSTSLFPVTAGYGGGSSAPTCSLSASPTQILSGESTTLSWSTSYGSSAVLNGSSVSLSGSESVSPSSNTTYTLSVSGSGSASCSASVDVAPVISSITANSISSTTETIIWTTDKAASSQTSYGLTTSYGSASSSSSLVTSHSITLTGLTASTTYDFQVSSTDPENNVATSSGQTFTTAAYNYYVDSVNGNDANPGTSPALAFQNITALPTITAGQSVGLAYGSHWRQQLTINAANVTVAGYPNTYNSTNLPILDASDIIPNTSFSKTAGYTNVYNTATTTFLAAGANGYVNVFETGGPGDSSTGTFLMSTSSIANVDAQACSYYVPGNTTTGNVPSNGVIYIHSCDGTSPTSNGYTYEFSNRGAGLSMTGYGGRVSYIETRKNAGANGALTLNGDGNSYFVNGIIARDGNKHVMFAPSGTTIENSEFIDAYFGYASFANLLVFFDGTGNGVNNATSTNNIFQQDQNVDPIYGTSAFIQHTGSGSFGNIYSTNDWFIGKNNAVMSGIGTQNASGLVIVGDHASNVGIVGAYQPTTVTNSQVVNTVYPSGSFGYAVNNTSLTLNNDDVCTSNEGNGLIYIGNTGDTLNINGGLYYVNTPVTGGYRNYVVLSPDVITLNVNNATFGTAATSYSVWNLYDTSSSTFSGNNNIYEKMTGTPSWTNGNTGYSTLASWQAAVAPQDSSSTAPATGTSAAAAACTLPTIPTVN